MRVAIGLDGSDVQAMTEQLRSGLVAKAPSVRLEGEVEIDEVLRRGWAQGAPRGGGQKGRLGRRRRLAGAPCRGTLAQDKPPILGLIQRGGQVVLRGMASLLAKIVRGCKAANA